MEVNSHQGIPVLPRDLWRAIIRIIEDDNPLECGNPFTQMVAFQTLAGVSKEFYRLIAERLADESQKQGLEYIPKLLQHEQNKIGVVGTLHRYYSGELIGFLLINFRFKTQRKCLRTSKASNYSKLQQPTLSVSDLRNKPKNDRRHQRQNTAHADLPRLHFQIWYRH